MITLANLRKVLFAILLIVPLVLWAQPERPVKNKPYRILTSGKQVTVKCVKEIKSLMVWTASGHRIVEQKDMNVSSFGFKVGTNEKYYFLMIHLTDGKVYTEKIGVP